MGLKILRLDKSTLNNIKCLQGSILNMNATIIMKIEDGE